MRWVNEEPAATSNTETQMTTAERLQRQRQANFEESERTWEYVQAPENQARYAEQREQAQQQAQQVVEEDEQGEVDIDYDFIGDLEGSTNTGYVPDPETSNSGVTVAVGFDLGARSEQDLNDLGLSSDLVDKLKPYLGLKKQAAVDALAASPLTITDDEADEIEEAVRESETDRIVNAYNASTSTVDFEDLPSEAQTVIASVGYQYGDLATRTPNFWTQATSQDWQGMYDNLLDFGDDYPTRRGKEADLLHGIL